MKLSPHQFLTHNTHPTPRQCTPFILTCAILTILLSLQFLLSPITLLRTNLAHVVHSYHRNHHCPTPTSHPLFPPPLSPLIAQPSTTHLFTVPNLLTYYEDRLPNNHTHIYLITSGIMMKVSKRNLTAVACLVGHDIYPSFLFDDEILHCNIPRPLRLGERLAPVLALDDNLKRAMEGPITLATAVVAELHPGDVVHLPESAILRAELATAKKHHFRLARSEVRVAPSENFIPGNAKFAPRYRLCLMTMVAPNSHMLKDWADYHRRIGVDHVYIFDNGAKRDLHKLFQNRMDVEIVKWPFHKSQRQAVSTFVFAGRARCERALLEDSDEYFMFGLGEGTSWRTGDPPLIRYAKKAEKEGFLHYKLLYLVMSNSGFLHRPKGEVPMNFIHRNGKQLFKNGKSVCYLDLEWQSAKIHNCGFISGKQVKIYPGYQTDIKKWGDKKMTPEHPDDPPWLVHFKVRSWEEFMEKWNAGRVSGKGVADMIAGTMSMDKPKEGHMKVDPKLEYTHFRDKIYSRVLMEGTLHEQTIVQMRGGQRCERKYRIDKDVRRLMHEACL